MDPETAAKEREELEGFFKEMDRKEKGLKGENKNSIFEETTNPKNEQDRQRKRQRAENAKNKGNEAMKSKDWAEAIQHYETAVSLDNKFHIAYGNLAQAYLELKSTHRLTENTKTRCRLLARLSKSTRNSRKATTGGPKQTRQWATSSKPPKTSRRSF